MRKAFFFLSLLLCGCSASAPLPDAYESADTLGSEMIPLAAEDGETERSPSSGKRRSPPAK